ncbi:uncharacterized protein LOC108166601 isoform X3 [Poecilia reticulata]|uniref:uncharacterized protein LOC108166601 isoform X3 n=1 Tax=Poecilia reticulata TaxID=8081 RepID=UPI0007E9C188|nr:PREDICTED: uncharacterized protein LOC108166601 isoform X3 [Poecilia reticulata]
MHTYDNENHSQMFYLFDRKTTVAASDLNVFRKQAEYLKFSLSSKFQYDTSKAPKINSALFCPSTVSVHLNSTFRLLLCSGLLRRHCGFLRRSRRGILRSLGSAVLVCRTGP